ncbi:hypothetical protein VTJ49DRAFT_126 [Mycothermus thermophilus]|uniref:Uncharacterized protein n=1 Tax=Humicola insolens TaxID=85995 RepID=A0ABR3VQI1_HUMIN
MESIQLAQMLADLSDLDAAQDSRAASALVNANRQNTTSHPADNEKASDQVPTRPGLQHHRRGSDGSAASAGSSFLSRTGTPTTTSPAKFDKLGRRILTPPNTQTNSAYGSIPGTPRRDSEVSSTSPSYGSYTLLNPANQQGDDDVDRANTLMALYDLRAKLKDQDYSRNLSKLREKIDALHARQQMSERKDSGDGRPKYTYPKNT